MLPTHALWGMLLAVPVALAMPEFASVALTAGFLGGVLPDLDMYVGHRRTLHYPVYYPVLGGTIGLLAVVVPTSGTIAASLVLLGAALHSVTDVFGGGLELRPWEGASDRAVYDHHHGRWIAPRRWVHYDGSPGDLLLSLAFAVPLLAVVDGVLQSVVAATAGVAVTYASVRRHLPSLAERLVAVLPGGVLARLPARYSQSRSGPTTIATDD